MNNMQVEAIEPKKEYSLKEIRDLRLIPWAVHYQTLQRIVSRDFIGDNILQAVRRGEGNGMRYEIRGSNIIKYMTKYTSGLMRTTKQNGNKKRRV